MTKHIEPKVFFSQAYCQLDHTKIMKYQSEEMLSNSLTKVMTTSEHHVKKCGLKDLQLATIAMAMITQVMVTEATATTVYVHGAGDN